MLAAMSPAWPQPRYPIVDTRLDNGLRLLVNPDASVPVAAVNLWYNVGSRHEQPGRTGFAHLFEHMMFEGSAHVPKGEHWRYVYAAGGTLNATTWCDRTNYFDTVPAHHVETVLWLEADRMGGLVVDQERFDNQREVVKNERRQSYENRPYGSWLERLHAIAFPPGHPYHHSTIGSMADLDAATLADVRAFHERYYAPNNAVLTVVGDVDPADVRAATERYFGALAPRESIPPAPDGTLPERFDAPARETVEDVVPVPRVYLAYRIPPFGTPAHDVAVLAGAVLGEGRGSRLYRQLVLTRQLAQPPDGSMADPWPFVGGASVFTVDVSAREGVAAGELEAAAVEVVASLASSPPTAAEMERARAQVVAGWLHRTAAFDSRADALSMYATLLGDPDLLNAQLPALLAVEAEQVADFAARLLRADNQAVLTFLPRGSG